MVEQASIIRQKRKTIKIAITNNADLVVYCPYGLKLDKIESILQNKKRILQKKIETVKQANAKFANITKRETILLFGKEYIIISTDKVRKACFSDEYFLIPKNKFEMGKCDEIIVKSLKEIASRTLIRRFKDILSFYKTYNVSKIILGSFKAKWGSCDCFGVIKLNWRLVMLPTKLVDFVIFHELSHLKELNHSKKFYYELEKVFPDWKASREELKNYSIILSLYQ